MIKRKSRAGFTLIELLIVMLIIAILAGLSYGALFKAQETSRVARTKALIAKLNGQMMARWEGYRTRRMPVAVTMGTAPRLAAQNRLDMLRQIMQMELPDKLADIPATPTNSLARHYRAKMSANGNQPFGSYEAAECLYMILTTSAGEEGLSAYELSNSEVGDFDGDGYKEFHDGWGRPISFIRWPTGFISDLQPLKIGGGPTEHDPINHHDPFDHLKIYPDAYELFPLIYSAGPDGEYGLSADGNASSNPYNDLTVGAPLDTDGDGSLGEHFDNIHNHLIGAR